jgi:hypothetical protein
MFRKNKKHQQAILIDSQFLLPPRLRRELEASWAYTFHHEVFVRIPEELFADLFIEEDSWPNAPVNILIGAEMLKTRFGWSDIELEEKIEFNLQVRYALGLNNLGEEVALFPTLNNFRHRLLEYAQKTGINLYQETFKAISDAHLEVLWRKTGWQKMDGAQLMSNIVLMNRLDLALAVFQKGFSVLPGPIQAKWRRDHEEYLGDKPQIFCHRVKPEDMEGRLVQVGYLLLELADALRSHQASGEDIELVNRALKDLFLIKDRGRITLRPASEISR